MMRVKLRTTMAGPSGTVQAGDVTTLPDPVARELVRAGFADSVDPATVPVAPPESVEAAVVSPPENAASRTTRPRGRRR